jgi:hypothetical protein
MFGDEDALGPLRRHPARLLDVAERFTAAVCAYDPTSL